MTKELAPIVELVEPTERTIQQTANMIRIGFSLTTIHEILLATDLTEYQVFLAVKAAEILTGLKAKKRIPSNCSK